MIPPLLPFGLLPAPLTPGWLFPGSGGYSLYRGASAAVDYQALAGFACGDASAISTINVAHEAGVSYHYAIRRTSDAGVEEHSTHLRCVVGRAAPGQDVMPLLPRAIQLQARWEQDGQVCIAWRLESVLGYAAIDRFELLRQDEGGQWTAFAEVRVANPAQRLFQWEGALPAPAVLAVRTGAASRLGPLSSPLTLNSRSIPTLPQLL